MGKMIAFAVLGAFIGLLCPAGDGGGLVPPARWTSSALLARYHAMEDELLRAEIQAERNGTFGVGASFDPAVNARKVASRGPPRSLFGEIFPDLSRPNFFRGRYALRVSCSGQENCCEQLLKWDESAKTWTSEAAADGLERGFLDDKKHFVLSIHHGFRAPELGLDFALAYAEVPLARQETTALLGYDPDLGSWKPRGKLVWKQEPPIGSCL